MEKLEELLSQKVKNVTWKVVKTREEVDDTLRDLTLGKRIYFTVTASYKEHIIEYQDLMYEGEQINPVVNHVAVMSLRKLSTLVFDVGDLGLHSYRL